MIPEDNHLFLGMNDINEPQNGFIAPDEQHITRFLGFVRQWHVDHAASSPLVIHCWAGVSRLNRRGLHRRLRPHTRQG